MDNMNNTNTQTQGGVPQEIKKWNWGAFCFSIWWGIGNKAYLTLLCLVPFLNIVWIFICGAMGNKWAWEAGDFKSVEDFKNRQESWNRAGFVAFWVMLAFLVFYIILFVAIGTSIIHSLPSSNYYL